MKGVVGLHVSCSESPSEKKRGSRTSPNFEHQGLARSWPPSIVRSSMTRCDGLDSGDLTHSPDSRRGVFQWRLAAAKNAAGTTFFLGGVGE